MKPEVNPVKFWLDKDPANMSVRDYAYYGGLVQGEGLKEYIDNFRSRKFDTASAIFWMYNDCWPATRSWTIVDYYLNRTPAFHPVRRAFAPVHITLRMENGRIKVIGINDLPELWKGTVKYGIFTLDGEYLQSELNYAEIGPDKSACLASFCEDPRGIPFAALFKDGVPVARNRLFTQRFYEMEWSGEKPAVRREGKYAVFSAKSFVWGVCIDLDGAEALGDNFFDVWPGESYRIPWPEAKPLPEILYFGSSGS